MDLTGEKVKHINLGIGTILRQTVAKDMRYLWIAFPDGEKEFQYPQAFVKLLVLQDDSKQIEIQGLLESIKEPEPPVPPISTKPPSTPPSPSTQGATTKLDPSTQRPSDSGVKTVKKPPIKKAIDEDCNLAIKCTYCDGGATKASIGFNGPCSDMMIIDNIEKKHHVWCSQQDCPCNEYLKGQIGRKELDELCSGEGFVCYESQMLRDWKVMGGTHHTGDRAGYTIPFKRTRPNTLVALTTRNPEDKETDRFIFGAFLVYSADEGDEFNWGSAEAHPKYRIELTRNEAAKMKYWKYHHNSTDPGNPKWGSGLHRYLSDQESAQILRDIASLKIGTKDEALAKEFFEKYCTLNQLDPEDLPKADGALLQRR